MRGFLEILRSGVDGLFLHPVRAAVTILALLASLVPFLAASCVSQGVAREAARSLSSGGDLYVTGNRMGVAAPVPAQLAAEIARQPGVLSATPRVVGPIVLGRDREPAVLVGIPVEQTANAALWVDGRLPRAGAANELALGYELARRLRLKLGDALPPFYHSRSGERVSYVVGILSPRATIWSARVVLTPFETAQQILDSPGMATDIQVRCQPGAEDEVARALLAGENAGPLRIVSRAEMQALLEQATSHREGIFNLHLVLALFASVGVVLVTSGLGQSDRVREVGLLKATGWATDEVLLRGLSESCCLGALALSVGVILTLVWLRFFNAWGFGALFISGLEAGSPVRVPYACTPGAIGMGMLLCFGVVLAGSLYPAWRAAVMSPLAALRR